MRKIWTHTSGMLAVLALVAVLFLAGCAQQGEKKPEESKVKITNLEPARGERGSTVVLYGVGFSDAMDDLVVNFGPTRATIKSSGDKLIAVEVPRSIVDGKYDITVTNTKLSSTSPPMTFTVHGGTALAEGEQPAGRGFVAGGLQPESKQPTTAGRGPAPEGSVARESSAPSAPTAPHAPVVQSLAVPAGTPLVVRTIDAISTKSNKPGDRIELSLDQPLIVDGHLLAPKGSRVIGRITQSKEPGRIKGRAQLGFTLVELIPAGGKAHTITSSVYSTQAPGSKKRDAMIIGGGAGIGAAIGAIAGGGKGAAIGAGVGAGSGTGVVVAIKGKQVEIPSETKFRFKLRAPVTLPVQGRAKSQAEEPS